MTKEHRIHPFATRLTRWLMGSLFITMGGVSYLIYELSSSLIVELESASHLNMLNTTNERINNVLSIVEIAAQNHLLTIEQHIEQPIELEQTMKTMLQLNPHITGISVAFVADYYPKQGRWYELYARRNNKSIEIEQIGSAEHDYQEADWFKRCLKTRKAIWSDAYIDNEGAHDLLTTYSQPIRNSQGNIIGVLGADVSLRWLQKELETIDIKNYTSSWFATDEDTGGKKRMKYQSHSFIIQQDGTYLVHSDNKRILSDNFFKYLENTKDSIDNKIIRSSQQGKREYLADDDDELAQINIDGKNYYVFYAPVERAGWITVTTLPTIAIDLISYLVSGVFLVVMIIGIIAAITVCNIVVRRATKPLKTLASAIGEVGNGHFDVALPTIKKHDEIRLLRDSFENMQHSLARYMEELKVTTAGNAAIERELRIAHDIQMTMLPKDYPPYPERKDIDIYGQLTPAKAVGGDLLDFYLRDNELFFCIGDVSGKGIPASLVMAVTRSLFRNILAHTSSPAQIVTDMNEALSENNTSCMFVTFFVGVLNLESGLMQYCNAGHHSPILIGRGIGTLPCDSNLPIGVMPDTPFNLQESIIDKGTTIFLYTDGLNEAEDATHAQFGQERITALAESLLLQERHQPQQLIDTMTDSVHLFVGEAEQSDDLTMLAIQLKAT